MPYSKKKKRSKNSTFATKFNSNSFWRPKICM